MTRVHSPSAHTQPGAATTVADILTAAADLIAQPGAWTQLGGDDDGSGGECARDENGNPVSAVDSDAACWCLFGAIERVTNGHDVRIVRALEWLTAKRSDDLVGFNDAPERTQDEVVAALRAAADKARTEHAVGTTEGREP